MYWSSITASPHLFELKRERAEAFLKHFPLLPNIAIVRMPHLSTASAEQALKTKH